MLWDPWPSRLSFFRIFRYRKEWLRSKRGFSFISKDVKKITNFYVALVKTVVLKLTIAALINFGMELYRWKDIWKSLSREWLIEMKENYTNVLKCLGMKSWKESKTVKVKAISWYLHLTKARNLQENANDVKVHIKPWLNQFQFFRETENYIGVNLAQNVTTLRLTRDWELRWYIMRLPMETET